MVCRRVIRCTVGVESDMRDSSRELFYRRYNVSSSWKNPLRRKNICLSVKEKKNEEEEETIRTRMRNMIVGFKPCLYTRLS